MKKIIQISTTDEDLYALTKDGKVYCRKVKSFERVGPIVREVNIYWNEVKNKETILYNDKGKVI